MKQSLQKDPRFLHHIVLFPLLTAAWRVKAPEKLKSKFLETERLESKYQNTVKSSEERNQSKLVSLMLRNVSDTGKPGKPKSEVSSLETQKLTILESEEQDQLERKKGDCESEDSKLTVEVEEQNIIVKQIKELKRSKSESESADSI